MVDPVKLISAVAAGAFIRQGDPGLGWLNADNLAGALIVGVTLRPAPPFLEGAAYAAAARLGGTFVRKLTKP